MNLLKRNPENKQVSDRALITSGVNVVNSIPQLSQFNRKKIKDIWTQTETVPRRFKVLRRECFADLSDAQIFHLRFVKMVEGSKLYDTLIMNQFNEIDPQQCDMKILLTELVIKVYCVKLDVGNWRPIIYGICGNCPYKQL